MVWAVTITDTYIISQHYCTNAYNEKECRTRCTSCVQELEEQQGQRWLQWNVMEQGNNEVYRVYLVTHVTLVRRYSRIQQCNSLQYYRNSKQSNLSVVSI